jgi:hypothetical protein
MTDRVVYRNGIGIGWVLFLIFLVLKLTKTIAWSWWWVTSPLWIPWIAVLGIFAVVFVVVFVVLIIYFLILYLIESFK